MTSALRALILGAILSAWPAGAAILDAEDVRQERASIPRDICQEKAQLTKISLISRSLLTARRASAGVSTINNKLGLVDVSQAVALRDNAFESIGTTPRAIRVTVEVTNFTTHYPVNGLQSVLNPQGYAHPENYLPPDQMTAGVNVLTPAGAVIAPSCLSATDLEDYLHFRHDLKVAVGDYWFYLHEGRFTDDELARLRYYDYLDIQAPKLAVPVYRCSAIKLGKH